MDRGDKQALLDQARAGDRAAFDCLQGSVEQPVRRFIRRLIGQGDSEDEIAQETFLALYLRLERIASIDHVLPFLFRVVRYLCYDELRRRGRFDVVSLDTTSPATNMPFTVAVDRRPAPDDIVHWQLVYSEVQDAMDRLPELQRQALILYCEQGLTYAQVVEAMETDIGTIKSRIHYGRKNVRKLVSPDVLGAMTRHTREDKDVGSR